METRGSQKRFTLEEEGLALLKRRSANDFEPLARDRVCTRAAEPLNHSG